MIKVSKTLRRKGFHTMAIKTPKLTTKIGKTMATPTVKKVKMPKYGHFPKGHIY